MQRYPGNLTKLPGAFVVSLDFELHWGVHDHTDRADFADRVLGARAAVPRLIERFDEHGVRATFATVGFLFADNSVELRHFLPAVLPHYRDGRLSPYPKLPAPGSEEDEYDSPDRYAASLVESIAAAREHELGSHSFSHCYALEPGMSHEALGADLAAAQAIARHRDRSMRSLVFPRNQYDDAAERIACHHGFDIVRTNPIGWMYRLNCAEQLTTRVRLGRFMDDVLPLSGSNCAPWPTRPSDSALPTEVAASRFLRPWARWSAPLAGLRHRRIASSMTLAARRGLVYHLWWHPHNFGKDMERNFDMLERILKHFTRLKDRHGMESHTMASLVERARAVEQGAVAPAPPSLEVPAR